MKSLIKFFFFIVLSVSAGHMASAQTESHEQNLQEETATVTFECNSCNVNNKFSITGSEKFKFKNVTFPFNQEMKLGDYQMIFWQNGIQQANSSFQINKGSENIIKVDEGFPF